MPIKNSRGNQEYLFKETTSKAVSRNTRKRLKEKGLGVRVSTYVGGKKPIYRIYVWDK
jgi:hypothetical protein